MGEGMTVKSPEDDGRRETVENLRHLSHMNRVRYREESYGLPDETVTEPDIGYREMNDVSERIADPIDRGECENVHDGNEMGACGNGFECPVRGCRVEDEGHCHVSGTWNFCPRCGRKAVNRAHRMPRLRRAGRFPRRAHRRRPCVRLREGRAARA